jgi:hypothetical protein
MRGISVLAEEVLLCLEGFCRVELNDTKLLSRLNTIIIMMKGALQPPFLRSATH